MGKNSNIGRQILASKSLLLISLLILVFFSFNLFKEIVNRRDLHGDIKILDDEITKLENKNQKLSFLIDYYESLEFVEKEARTKLNLRKPGEKIIIVSEDNEDVTEQTDFFDTTVLTSSDIIHLTNPQKWWNYFFKIN